MLGRDDVGLVGEVGDACVVPCARPEVSNASGLEMLTEERFCAVVEVVALALLPRAGIACCAEVEVGAVSFDAGGSLVDPVLLSPWSDFCDEVAAPVNLEGPLPSLEEVFACRLVVLAGAVAPGSLMEVGRVGFGGGGIAFLSSLVSGLDDTSLSDVSSLIVPTVSFSSSVDVLRENVGSKLRLFDCFDVVPPSTDSFSDPEPLPSPICCNFFKCSVGTSNMDIGRAFAPGAAAGRRAAGRRLGEAIVLETNVSSRDVEDSNRGEVVGASAPEGEKAEEVLLINHYRARQRSEFCTSRMLAVLQQSPTKRRPLLSPAPPSSHYKTTHVLAARPESSLRRARILLR